MGASPRLERIAAALERIADALERDAAMGAFLDEALGMPSAPGPVDPDALDWRNGPDGGFTVADPETGERREATADEAAAIRASIKPKPAGRRR